MNPLRSFIAALIGFAAVVIVAVVVLATTDAASFHRGGEFASAWQSAEFDLLAWGIVLVFSGGAFALVTFFLIPSGRLLPLPLLVGIVCGAGVAAMFGSGLANHLQRPAGIPWPLIAIGPGVVTGGCVVVLALATNLFSTAAQRGIRSSVEFSSDAK
jgi:NO-binding membrane sensor protein with MHYT domain